MAFRVPGFQVVRPASGERSEKLEPAESSTRVLKLGPGKHRIEFQYTALGFDAPERIRFRYRLEGLDSDWVEAGNRRVAFYSYVPPGSYQFHVIACNADGLWNETGATLALTVSKYFWQTWWFLGLSSLTLLVLVVGGRSLCGKKKTPTPVATTRTGTRLGTGTHPHRPGPA